MDILSVIAVFRNGEGSSSVVQRDIKVKKGEDCCTVTAGSMLGE